MVGFAVCRLEYTLSSELWNSQVDKQVRARLGLGLANPNPNSNPNPSSQVDKQVARFLAIAGTSLRESVKDPYAPEP